MQLFMHLATTLPLLLSVLSTLAVATPLAAPPSPKTPKTPSPPGTPVGSPKHGVKAPAPASTPTPAALVHTKNYIEVKKVMGGTALVKKHKYAFKEGSWGLSHHRLIVGEVVDKAGGKAGELDFVAHPFELTYDPTIPAGQTNIILNENKDKEWQCSGSGQTWTYKGEVLSFMKYEDIHSTGKVLMIGKERYSLLTNNCQHYASRLFTAIKATKVKARKLLDEYLKLKRDIDFQIGKLRQRSYE